VQLRLQLTSPERNFGKGKDEGNGLTEIKQGRMGEEKKIKTLAEGKLLLLTRCLLMGAPLHF
jgi:hypothetical protein